MAFITVTVTNLGDIKDKLTALGAKMHDFTTAMEAVGDAVGKYFSGQVFASEGAVLGSRWAELTPATQAEKNHLFPGRGILERTGAMREGFTSDATPMSVWVSNEAPYFPYHQLGTTNGAGRGHNIPARPMIGVNDAVESIIGDIIRADVNAKIEAFNGR